MPGRIAPRWSILVFTIGMTMSMAGVGMPGAAFQITVTSANAEAQQSEHTKFDDRDRETVRSWYIAHRDRLPPGFRDQDRLPPQWEARLQPGSMLDVNMRRRVRPVPPDLIRTLPAPPRDYRYAVLDGHIIIVGEKTWHVSDVLHFHMDIGR